MKRFLPFLVLVTLCCTGLEEPELISPADGETVMTATPKFTWHSTPDARSYSVEISAEESFAETIDSIIFKDTSFILADTLKLGQEYHWRVIARNLQGVESNPSEPETFHVQSGVGLLSPAAYDSTAWPEFSWGAYPGASSYNLTISSYADFREPFFDTTTGSTSLQWPDSLAPATYFWRVQAFDANRPLSSPSTVRRLVSYRLEDTYFPLKPGRSQTFQIVELKGFYVLGTPNEWDTTEWDTSQYTVNVDNTFADKERLYYVLSSDSFWDIGDSVGLKDDSLFSPVFFMSELYPTESAIFRTWQDSTFTVLWDEDTLRLLYTYGLHRGSLDSLIILRLPGQGVIEQRHYWERRAVLDTHDWLTSRTKLLP
ncbi:hypothetical protein CEE36_05545 [candidate division TA06 bacterium B3_TA06]|uniref:Fibronectin type-III domain-containing protein n=1 Tax=candidate division TA06 bacterium B3_TA06 TaxID=2012487 RepID=A0A532V6Z0_UNCT6|nr:MAG: hypothetical protein CEE36_05545 [candidate division TA06 bacterium B3_TA06]